jgi:CubicO group peptidase (beta-lactamase class C family)
MSRLLQRLTRNLEAAVERHNVPGAAMAVFYQNEVFSAVAGHACRETGRRVTLDTPFSAGCIFKPIIASLVMRVAERHALSIDRPVADSLPDYRGPDPSISLRHLLSHSAGIDSNVQWDTGDEEGCLEKFVARSHELAGLAAPGSLFGYGPAAYVIAARLAEAVSGVRLRALLDREIFAPLGISYPWTAETRAERARGYVRDEDHECRPVQIAHIQPRAYEVASDRRGMTLHELLAFGMLHLPNAPKPLLSAASSSAMREPQIDVFNSYVPAWGLGWAIWGDGSFGHNGFDLGFASHLRVIPRRQMVVVLFCNVYEDWALHNSILAEVLADPGQCRATIPPPAAPRELNLARFTGIYEGAMMRMLVRLQRGTLRLSTQLADDALAPAVQQLARVDHAYRVPADYVLDQLTGSSFRAREAGLPIDFFSARAGARADWLRYTNKVLRRVQ